MVKTGLLNHITSNNQKNIKGWCSNNIKNCELFGWLINERSFAPRKALIIINNSTFTVECNQRRTKPNKYKEHIDNGFRLRLSQDFITKLPSNSLITMVDEETKVEVYRSTLSFK